MDEIVPNVGLSHDSVHNQAVNDGLGCPVNQKNFVSENFTNFRDYAKT